MHPHNFRLLMPMAGAGGTAFVQAAGKARASKCYPPAAQARRQRRRRGARPAGSLPRLAAPACWPRRTPGCRAGRGVYTGKHPGPGLPLHHLKGIMLAHWHCFTVVCSLVAMLFCFRWSSVVAAHVACQWWLMVVAHRLTVVAHGTRVVAEPPP